MEFDRLGFENCTFVVNEKSNVVKAESRRRGVGSTQPNQLIIQIRYEE